MTQHLIEEAAFAALDHARALELQQQGGEHDARADRLTEAAMRQLGTQ